MGDQKRNPEFYNWNLVWFRYCDGGSFSGDNEAPYTLQDGKSFSKTNLPKIFFRGYHIFNAILDDLVAKYNLNSASNVLLAGTSAGGLATALRCDELKYKKFKYQVENKDLDIKCVADTGMFIDIMSIYGEQVIRSEYKSLVDLHRPRFSEFCDLGLEVDSGVDPMNCFFPEYFIQNIKTNFLIIQPLYDAWQTMNIWFPKTSIKTLDQTGTTAAKTSKPAAQSKPFKQ